MCIDNIVFICYIVCIMIEETKNQRFKRLAKRRGERILKDIRLLGNLANTNNYEFSDEEIRKVFGVIESDLKATRQRFDRMKRRKIEL